MSSSLNQKIRKDAYSVLFFSYICNKLGIKGNYGSIYEDYDNFDFHISDIHLEFKVEKERNFKAPDGDWAKFWKKTSCRAAGKWQGNVWAKASSQPLQMLKPLKYSQILEKNGRLVMIARDGIVSMTAKQLREGYVETAKWWGRIFQEAESPKYDWQERIIFDMSFGKYTPWTDLIPEDELEAHREDFDKIFEKQEGKEIDKEELIEFARHLGISIYF